MAQGERRAIYGQPEQLVRVLRMIARRTARSSGVVRRLRVTLGAPRWWNRPADPAPPIQLTVDVARLRSALPPWLRPLASGKPPHVRRGSGYRARSPCDRAGFRPRSPRDRPRSDRLSSRAPCAGHCRIRAGAARVRCFVIMATPRALTRLLHTWSLTSWQRPPA